MGPTRANSNGHAIAAGLVVLCWLVVASLWLSSPGLHYDETIFVSGMYPEKPGGAVWKLEFNDRPIAVMVMSYMGALKGWMYRVLLMAFEPSAFSVRFPLLLLTAITIALTYKLTAEIFDRTTGLIAVVLLGTDVTFLLTSRMDWGPEVFQRLCLVAGTLLIVHGYRLQRSLRIAGGLGVFGLALFDKLTFEWLLFGLLLALLATYPRALLRTVKTNRLPLYLLAIVVPASPLIYYRLFVAPPDTTSMEGHAEHFLEKYWMLQQSLDGTVLSGPMAYQSADRPFPAVDLPTKALYWLAPDVPQLTGAFTPVVIFSLVAFSLTVFLPGGRNLAFVLLFCAFAWIPMVLIEGAGSVHHLTLVYPFPHIFVAASFTRLAAAAEKRTGRKIAAGALIAATAWIAQANVKNIAHKYAEFVRYGGRPVWTEAIYELYAFLQGRPEKHILIADWGIEHQLIFLSRNRMPLASLPTAGPENEAALKIAVSSLDPPDLLVVQYAPAVTPSPQVHELIDEAVSTAGVELRPVAVIHDRQGREMYRVLSCAKRDDATAIPRPE